MTPAYYTTEEVADRLRVKMQTVQRWIRGGRLRAAKFGKEYRISQEALEAFEKEATKRGAAESESTGPS